MGKKKHGRPTKLDDIDLEQLKRLLQLGLDDKEVAEFYQVTMRTVNNWKDDPDFFEAYQYGKITGDLKLVGKLRERAEGYDYTERKVYKDAEGNVTKVEETQKHRPPEIGAIKQYLKNRHPDLWGDKSQLEITGKDGTPLALQARSKIDYSKLDDQHLPAIMEIIESLNPEPEQIEEAKTENLNNEKNDKK